MNRSKLVVYVIIIAAVVAAVSVAVLTKRLPGLPGEVSDPGAVGSDNPFTRESIDDIEIVVPEQNATNTPENVAAPSVVSPGNQTGTTSYRSFDIVAEKGKFTPDTIIVNQGDTTNINVTAVDRDYDFTQPDYGFKEIIPKGTTKRIQFGATATGKFTFFCASCGGPEKGPVGFVIVAAK